MKLYFDFKGTDNTKSFRDNNDPNFIEAWNQQCYINTDRYMYKQDFKILDSIKEKLDGEYKKNPEEFKANVLNNGQLSMDEAARGVYSAIRYSIIYGAQGKCCWNDFFNDNLGDMTGKKIEEVPTLKAFKDVVDSVTAAIPEISPNVLKGIVSDFRNSEIQRVELSKAADNEGKLLGRDAQIEFVKNSIDSQYTTSQKFRAVMSSLKEHFNGPSVPSSSLGEAVVMTAVKAVTYTAMAPFAAAALGVKVLGGEATEMKIQDAADKVGEKYFELADGISKVKNNVLGVLDKFRSDPNAENNNKLKM